MSPGGSARRARELRRAPRLHSYLYYVRNQPEISDERFDERMRKAFGGGIGYVVEPKLYGAAASQDSIDCAWTARVVALSSFRVPIPLRLPSRSPKAERTKLRRLAEDWGISEAVRRDAHQEYFACIVRSVERDGIVSEAEHETLTKIARQLGIVGVEIPGVTERLKGGRLRRGTRVCFTGEAIVCGEMWHRARLETVAMRAHMIPVRTVTKKGCDLLVAADVATASGKARKARRYGVPLLSVTEFVDRVKAVGVEL